MKGLAGREIFKNYIKSICKFLVACIVAVVIFFAGGLFESLKHPAIVIPQCITMEELKDELLKYRAFFLQVDSQWDLGFIPDKQHLACVGLILRPLTNFQEDYIKTKTKAIESNDLSIAGAGDQHEQKRNNAH